MVTSGLMKAKWNLGNVLCVGAVLSTFHVFPNKNRTETRRNSRISQARISAKPLWFMFFGANQKLEYFFPKLVRNNNSEIPQEK